MRAAATALIFLVGSAVSSPAMAGEGANSAGHAQSAEAAAAQANGNVSGHGANVNGPYNSTRDGSASGNGNGNGEATGRPCAGCVGNADDKNPQGQLPNGFHDNAGYECDRNHGVAQTNPAHTGCGPDSKGNGDDHNGDDHNGDNGKGDDHNGKGDDHNGKGDDQNGDDHNGAAAGVPPSDHQRVLPAALPKTGPALWLLPVAAGLLLAGGMLTVVGRRRQSTP
jgi:LPXTG-motif cell wall-anchored protein